MRDVYGVDWRLAAQVLEYRVNLQFFYGGNARSNLATRMFFLLTFFSIGLVSNFRKLKEEGIGRLAVVYIVCLFGFIIWVGLFISYAFFHGMPLAISTCARRACR